VKDDDPTTLEPAKMDPSKRTGVLVSTSADILEFIIDWAFGYFLFSIAVSLNVVTPTAGPYTSQSLTLSPKIEEFVTVSIKSTPTILSPPKPSRVQRPPFIFLPMLNHYQYTHTCGPPLDLLDECSTPEDHNDLVKFRSESPPIGSQPFKSSSLTAQTSAFNTHSGHTLILLSETGRDIRQTRSW
jgi:hypothetical protein